jgi:crotonobetainyl-CoA:carnitine CoA-transferase CaiB-like acyl-CoA transferase
MPLAGVRVLDFTRHMAGPYATLTLSDYGADVIKIESLGGDPSRRTGVDFVGEESALFLNWNRGKRSIALDLRRPEAIEAIERLVPGADVVVENYRPGQADKIGIGYEKLAAINEGIIYCSISAFGPEGPLAPYPGTDPVVQAASGVVSVTGEPDRGPSLVGVPIADFTGAMLCVQAALLGLLARERTGRGQHIQIPMLSGLLSALTTRLASFWTTGENPKRYGGAHSVEMPYEVFATADGHAVAGVWGGNDGWGPFCEAVGLPLLAADERYAENQDRVRLREEIKPLLAAEFAKRTTAEWEERFRSRGVLFNPVYSFSEILNHPHVTGSGLIQSVEHPTAGTVPQLGPVLGLSETPGAISGPPPLLGQHTAEILAEAGLDEDRIAAFESEGIAGFAGEHEPVAADLPIAE